MKWMRERLTVDSLSMRERLAELKKEVEQEDCLYKKRRHRRGHREAGSD